MLKRSEKQTLSVPVQAQATGWKCSRCARWAPESWEPLGVERVWLQGTTSFVPLRVYQATVRTGCHLAVAQRAPDFNISLGKKGIRR